MITAKKADLRDILIDAHAHFFILKGHEAARIRLWQIMPDSIVIDNPVGAPMRKTMLGYIPTIDGNGVYEIDGTVCVDPLPDQMPNTIRIEIEPSRVKRVNRRQYPRVNFTPPVDGKASAAGEKKACAIRVVNFSAGGMRIESKAELPPDKDLKFNFSVEIDDESHDVQATGRVAYVLPLEGCHAYGIKFIFSEAKDKSGEVSIDSLDKTVDLMNLVNRLLIREVS